MEDLTLVFYSHFRITAFLLDASCSSKSCTWIQGWSEVRTLTASEPTSELTLVLIAASGSKVDSCLGSSLEYTQEQDVEITCLFSILTLRNEVHRVNFETRFHQSEEGAGQLGGEVLLFTFVFIIAASKEDNEKKASGLHLVMGSR